jgi:bile acid:Na+ symporter, BASS family
MKLQALILLILRASLALSVFALGLGSTFADSVYLFRRLAKLARASLSMNVLMPAIALLLVLKFDLDPAVKIALGALSLSPVPPIFPKNALQEGGKGQPASRSLR